MDIGQKLAKAQASRSSAGTDSFARVLSAAKSLFLEMGFEKASLEAVARKAGSTRQTVYNLFGSKEALFRAVVEEHWHMLAAERDAIFSETFRIASSDPEEVLLRFGHAIAHFVESTDQVSFTQFVIAESRRNPWIADAFYRTGKGPLLQAFVDCLRALTDAKRLDCPDPNVAAHQFFGMVQEFVIWPQVMGFVDVVVPSPDRVIAEAVATFMCRYAPSAKRVRQGHGAKT